MNEKKKKLQRIMNVEKKINEIKNLIRSEKL